MTLTVLNPATEEPIAELEPAGVEETDEAVAHAKAAFPSWRAVSPSDRARLLRRLAALVEEHGEELARIESRNVGKPIAGARAEVGMVADVFHFYAGAVDKHHGETIPVAGGVDLTFREPLGVVASIVPWNFPLNIASWKLGPALACGNTVVLKPAELTPLSALRLAELALEAGIPEGVMNVVAGKGSVVGQRLVEHPDVAKVGFTGSTEVGRAGDAGRGRDDQARDARARWQVGERGLRRRRSRASSRGRAVRRLRQRRAGLLRPQPHPRREDGVRPVPRAARGGHRAASRSEIPRTRRQRWARSSRPSIGRTLRPSSTTRVSVVFRGEAPKERGFFFPCTLVESSNDDRIAREEVFGPIAAVIPFADEAEAIRLANDTPYGLSGSIWTRDGARALRVARALETGVLSVNSNSSVRVQTPFGGMKMSGFGRELGMHALEGYSEVKNVFVATG